MAGRAGRGGAGQGRAGLQKCIYLQQSLETPPLNDYDDSPVSQTGPV